MRGMIHYVYRVAAVGHPIGPFEAFLRLLCLGSFTVGVILMIIPAQRDTAINAMLLGGFGFIALAAGWRGYNGGDEGTS